MQLIQNIFLGLERWVKSSWSKLHHQNISHPPSPAEQERPFQRHILSISLTPQHPEQPRGLHLKEGKTSHTKFQSEAFKGTRLQNKLRCSSKAPLCHRQHGKVSGCRAQGIIGLIYSYQHGTWFESSITVTPHSGVCMLQRASKLERNLPPAAEHYITINRKQAESSRRSPSLACTVMLMEMYTHSSICTYCGARQTVGLHC